MNYTKISSSWYIVLTSGYARKASRKENGFWKWKKWRLIICRDIILADPVGRNSFYNNMPEASTLSKEGKADSAMWGCLILWLYQKDEFTTAHSFTSLISKLREFFCYYIPISSNSFNINSPNFRLSGKWSIYVETNSWLSPIWNDCPAIYYSSGTCLSIPISA